MIINTLRVFALTTLLALVAPMSGVAYGHDYKPVIEKMEDEIHALHTELDNDEVFKARLKELDRLDNLRRMLKQLKASEMRQRRGDYTRNNQPGY